jgi:ribonuclease HI
VKPVASDLWVVHIDGGAVPNPGRMGVGAVMIDPHGRRHTLSLACHATGCNNEAELRALMSTLEALQSFGATTLLVHSDNSILVEQLSADNIPPIARLAALFDQARALIASFEHVGLKWIPRHRNGEADALARQALGLPLKQVAQPSMRKRRS